MSPDLILLQKRLDLLIKSEQYERCIVIKRWMDELEKISKKDETHHSLREISK